MRACAGRSERSGMLRSAEVHRSACANLEDLGVAPLVLDDLGHLGPSGLQQGHGGAPFRQQGLQGALCRPAGEVDAHSVELPG